MSARLAGLGLAIGLLGTNATGLAEEPPIPTANAAAPILDVPAASPDKLDFQLFPPEPPENPARVLQLQSQVKLRRSLLEWHQGLGIATALLMVATVISGQLDYTDRFGGGTSTGRYEATHSSLSAITTVAFATDGVLALVAPVPFPKRNSHVDSLWIHKVAMLVATAGFASEIPLGIYTASREGHINQADFAVAHLIIGYVTGAALAAGVGALAL